MLRAAICGLFLIICLPLYAEKFSLKRDLKFKEGQSKEIRLTDLTVDTSPVHKISIQEQHPIFVFRNQDTEWVLQRVKIHFTVELFTSPTNSLMAVNIWNIKDESRGRIRNLKTWNDFEGEFPADGIYKIKLDYVQGSGDVAVTITFTLDCIPDVEWAKTNGLLFLQADESKSFYISSSEKSEINATGILPTESQWKRAYTKYAKTDESGYNFLGSKAEWVKADGLVIAALNRELRAVGLKDNEEILVYRQSICDKGLAEKAGAGEIFTIGDSSGIAVGFNEEAIQKFWSQVQERQDQEITMVVRGTGSQERAVSVKASLLKKERILVTDRLLKGGVKDDPDSMRTPEAKTTMVYNPFVQDFWENKNMEEITEEWEIRREFKNTGCAISIYTPNSQYAIAFRYIYSFSNEK